MKADNNKIILTLSDKKQETHDTFTLYFKKEKDFNFIAGQYITVYTPLPDTPEGKAYSISSTPDDRHIALTIKKMGVFSNYLTDLEKGSKIEASNPYGFFYTEERNNLVCIAGGVGITPFKSIIFSHVDEFKKINLWYSNKTQADIIFKTELEDLKKKKNNFNLTNYITREKIVENQNYKNGRIDIKEALKTLENPQNTDFMICGSISFVRDMWKDLKNASIGEANIYTESFY